VAAAAAAAAAGKVKYLDIAVRTSKHASLLRELSCYMGSHSRMLPLRGDIPAFTPVNYPSTRLSDPGGMQD